MDPVHRTLSINGIQMHLAEQGTGPLVILCHGWPETWHSWRHQLPALAAAGYRVVAPDMRGFARTDAPSDVSAYTILHNVGDMVSLVAALDERQAVIVGHDWGAPTAWSAAMMRPDVFRAVVGMSVPHRPRGSEPPLAALRRMGLHNYYWLYFQAEGVAEAEFERDVPTTMRKLLYGVSGNAPVDRENPLMVPEGKGFLDRLAVPERLPDWLTEEDVAFVAGEYQRTGFRGGLNLYRNIDRNWELTAAWAGARILQPALFIAGTRDPVIAGPRGRAAVDQMQATVPNVRQVLIDGAGHWIQQERSEAVNTHLVEFLAALPGPDGRVTS